MAARRTACGAQLSRRGHLFAAGLLVAVSVLRATSIAAAHGLTFDEPWHLRHGLAFWTRTLTSQGLQMNDPPLGAGIVALPLLLLNALYGEPLAAAGLYGRPFSAEAAQTLLALWHWVLYLLALAGIGRWAHSLYGAAGAWLVVILLAVEPNLVAHTSIVTVDVLATTAILLCLPLSAWFIARPSATRAFTVGLAVTAALQIKHTAVLLPALVLLGVVRRLPGMWPSAAEGVRWLAAAACAGLIGLWMFSLFDYSPPGEWVLKFERQAGRQQQAASENAGLDGPGKVRALGLDRPWPAGTYLASLVGLFSHSKAGHPGYLLGEYRKSGWWYYLPVVATYKIPLGVWALGLLAAYSLRVRRLQPGEWDIVAALLAFSIFLSSSGLAIGFRHAFPAYACTLLLVPRVTALGRSGMISAWLLVAATGLEAWTWHPDYLSYVNRPAARAYLDITDSNIDWGQSLKQLRGWLDSNPSATPVVLAYFGTDSVQEHLGARVRLLPESGPLPSTGLLAVSPTTLLGVYAGGPDPRLEPFITASPLAIVGHAMLVFDLAARRDD